VADGHDRSGRPLPLVTVQASHALEDQVDGCEVGDEQVEIDVEGLLDDLARTLPVTEQRLETYYRSSALRLVFVHAFRPAAHRWLPIWVRHCLGDASPFMSLDLTNDWNDS